MEQEIMARREWGDEMKFIVEKRPYDAMQELIGRDEVIDDVRIMEGIIWNEEAIEAFDKIAEGHFTDPPDMDGFAEWLNGNVVEILERLGVES